MLVAFKGHNVVIDTTPDFRTQILRAHVDHLDAVVYTHPTPTTSWVSTMSGRSISARASTFRSTRRPETLEVIRRAFSYIFDETEPLTSRNWNSTNRTDRRSTSWACIHPVPMQHGHATIFGFRFGDVAYLTDHSGIPDASMDLLRVSTYSFSTRFGTNRIPPTRPSSSPSRRPRRCSPSYLFHPHLPRSTAREDRADLPPNVFLAYDGLEIEVAAA